MLAGGASRKTREFQRFFAWFGDRPGKSEMICIQEEPHFAWPCTKIAFSCSLQGADVGLSDGSSLGGRRGRRAATTRRRRDRGGDAAAATRRRRRGGDETAAATRRRRGRGDEAAAVTRPRRRRCRGGDAGGSRRGPLRIEISVADLLPAPPVDLRRDGFPILALVDELHDLRLW